MNTFALFNRFAAFLIVLSPTVLAGCATASNTRVRSTGAAQQDTTPVDAVVGPYMGAKPGSTPQLLAPTLLASPMQVYNGTFSPDGRTFFYTVEARPKSVIAMTEMAADGSWSKPVVAPFSGPFTDYDPLFAPDGTKLFFSSQRPWPEAEYETSSLWHPRNKTHVWSMNRTANGWSIPVPVKLTDKGDYYNSLTTSGDLYFNVWAEGDIYRAKPTADGYQVEKLGPSINDKGPVGDPFISPNGDYLIFRGYGPQSMGLGDLFISFNIDGQWSVAQNLGAPINSDALEACPFVTADGKMLIFASSRLQKLYNPAPKTPVSEVIAKYTSIDSGELNIYQVSTDFIERLRRTAKLPPQP